VPDRNTPGVPGQNKSGAKHLLLRGKPLQNVDQRLHTKVAPRKEKKTISNKISQKGGQVQARVSQRVCESEPARKEKKKGLTISHSQNSKKSGRK